MLKLDQVQEIELPAVPNFTYSVGTLTFNCDRAAPEKDRATPKYVLHLHDGGQKIARCAFFIIDEIDPEIMFGGILVEPQFQGRGVGGILLKELFYIADKARREFICAMPQRKPAMCVLLDRFGFEPVLEGNWTDVRERVDVARSEDGKTLLKFAHGPKGEQFSRSHIVNSQSYCLVPDMREAREKPTTVYLNRLYLLVDEQRNQMMLNGNITSPDINQPRAYSRPGQTLVDRPLES